MLIHINNKERWQITIEGTAHLEEGTTIASGAIEVINYGIVKTGGRAKMLLDDDEYDRRPQRRRYEEPLHVKVQKQLLGIAESVQNEPVTCKHSWLITEQPLKKTEDEITSIARIVSEGYEDEKLRNTYLDLTVQLYVHR